MTDNQTCYVCGKPCRPGAGLTDKHGRRHKDGIPCPPPGPGPEEIARRVARLAKANSGRRGTLRQGVQ